MMSSELVIKMAKGIVRNLQRSKETIQSMAYGITAETILLNGNNILGSLKDTLDIIKGFSIGNKKEAGGISIRDEIERLVTQLKDMDVQFDRWGTFQKDAVSFKGTINKRRVIIVSSQIKSVLNEIKSVLITFPKSRLNEGAKNVIRSILRKIVLKINSVDKFIREVETWRMP